MCLYEAEKRLNERTHYNWIWWYSSVFVTIQHPKHVQDGESSFVSPIPNPFRSAFFGSITSAKQKETGGKAHENKPSIVRFFCRTALCSFSFCLTDYDYRIHQKSAWEGEKERQNTHISHLYEISSLCHSHLCERRVRRTYILVRPLLVLCVMSRCQSDEMQLLSPRTQSRTSTWYIHINIFFGRQHIKSAWACSVWLFEQFLLPVRSIRSHTSIFPFWPLPFLLLLLLPYMPSMMY